MCLSTVVCDEGGVGEGNRNLTPNHDWQTSWLSGNGDDYTVLPPAVHTETLEQEGKHKAHILLTRAYVTMTLKQLV